MLDYFFSLDQLLADEYVGALDADRLRYAHSIYIVRRLIEDENNA